MLVKVFGNFPIVSIYFSPLSNTIYLREIFTYVHIFSCGPLRSVFSTENFFEFPTLQST